MSKKSNLKMVDAHIHWWDLDNNYYPWLMDEQPEVGGLSGFDAIAHTYLQSHYHEDADGYDVEGYVHIQAEWDPRDPLGESQWLQKLVDDDELGGKRLAIVGFANLAADNVESLLEGHAALANVRGIRHMLNHIADNPSLCWADQDYLANDKWVENYGLLKKYDLDFDLMCFSNHFERAAALAKKHSETRVFIEHAGMPYDETDEGVAYWRSGMKSLAEAENTIAKISGFGTTMPKWTEESIKPYVLDIIDYFGVDRVCIATNYPTDKMFRSMDEILKSFLSITSGFSDQELDKLYANNARTHYRF